MKRPRRILITCGEVSGDLHASKLIAELKSRFPDVEIVAFGGDRVAASGADLLFHTDDFASVIGLTGVIVHLPKLLRLERGLKKALETVDLFIPVDYPGLNLRLAERAKQLGVPVLYYISPQVWAWGSGRIEKMSRLVDYMAVILPFEEKIYKERGIPAEFVGHPFVEDHGLPEPTAQSNRAGVGLLPGSRASEIRRILPILLDTAKRIQEKKPHERFVVGCSPSVPRALYEKIVSRHDIDVELDDNVQDVMSGSSLLLVASGTATLQGALLQTPLIVVYRVSMLNYLIAKSLVKIDRIGLVNIILDSDVCPEFIQVEAKPEQIARRALLLLEDGDERRNMISRFAKLRSILTGPGGCRRVAEISEQLLDSA